MNAVTRLFRFPCIADCGPHGFLFSNAICRGIRQTRRMRQDSDEDDCTLVGLCAELAAGLAVGVELLYKEPC